VERRWGSRLICLAVGFGERGERWRWRVIPLQAPPITWGHQRPASLAGQPVGGDRSAIGAGAVRNETREAGGSSVEAVFAARFAAEAACRPDG
jgi:hypothetical protein